MGSAAAAFGAFPRLRLIASTRRTVASSDRHELAARIDIRGRSVETEAVELAGIVDRIGGGDAFAAGVLQSLADDEDIETAAKTGLALSVLKHTLPGDAGLFRRSDLAAYLAGELDVRR